MYTQPPRLFNETKFLILDALFHNGRDLLTPHDIADRTGLSYASVCSNLRRLTIWGYIWRRRERRETKKNYFCYRRPHHKGIRVYKKLLERKRITEATGIYIPLRLDKPITKFIPLQTWIKYKQENEN